jgi:hypothetical protein
MYENNPLRKSDLFVTPKSFSDLLEQADQCSHPYHVVMLAMNYCHAQVEREITATRCVNGDPNCTICV